MTCKGRIICEALKKKLRKCTEEKNKKTNEEKNKKRKCTLKFNVM